MSLFTLPGWAQALRSRLASASPSSVPATSPESVLRLPLPAPGLAALTIQDESRWPRAVQESSATVRYLRLLAPIDWARFPEPPGRHHCIWPDCPLVSLSTLAAACLIKLDQHLAYVSDLRRFLVEHPPLVWALGFPLTPSERFTWGFDVEASLPTHRHFARLLRECPNAILQFLLDQTVYAIRADLLPHVPAFGDCISLDTKHIIAWVKENNPKAYIHGKRYDKAQQLAGDPDCRLGCKRKSNQSKAGPAKDHASPSPAAMPTPTTDAVPARGLAVGEYYWGYASGVVATKVPTWGEFVLAELTQPFDQPDVSYFHPLMAATEQRLAHKPRFGAFDAAFDAFYVYEYFHHDGGFAAVPFTERGGHGTRAFSSAGAPLCAAGLPMTLACTFLNRSGLFPHQCQRYTCPLRQPDSTAEACPVQHARWSKGGCTATLAASIGARLRYQIDRAGSDYLLIYRQRTATERINAQAVALGIERPKLRNAASIANLNTLTYVLINLHALQRIRQHLADCAVPSAPADAPQPGTDSCPEKACNQDGVPGVSVSAPTA